MAERLKVLISAYACEPGKGSEPGVGWNWVLHIQRLHDVCVLTRANNRPSIESALKLLPDDVPVPKFYYHDLAGPILWGKKHLPGGMHGYYYLWQQSAWKVVADLQRTHQFDLLHHLTYASFRFRTAVWNHGLPSVWGPVAGIVTTPWNLLPWFHPRPLIGESVRNIVNVLQSSRFSSLLPRARRSTVVIAVSPAMQAPFVRLAHEAEVLPTIAVPHPPARVRPLARGDGPLRLLFAGRIIFMKGIELALHALKESGTSATLTLIGDGPYLPVIEKLTRRLALEDRVRFLGWLPFETAVKTYEDYDAFCFPSLHDSGGCVVLEAMSCGLPVICLDRGGPGFLVSPGCGIKVDLGPKRKIIADFARAIRTYDTNRQLLHEHGAAAYESILAHHTWERRMEQMNIIYQEAVNRPPTA